MAVLLTAILVPFMVLSSRIIHEGHQYALAIALMPIAASSLRMGPLRAFCYMVTAYVTVDFVLAIMRIGSWGVAHTSLGAVVFIATGAVAYSVVSKSEIKKEIFYNVLCVMAIVQAAFAIFQMSGIDLFLAGYELIMPVVRLLSPTDPIGTLGNPNFLSAYIAFSLPFFLRPGWKWFIFPLLAVVVACKTSGAAFAIACGVAYLFLDKPRHRVYVAAGALVFAAAYIYMDAETVFNSERWMIWYNALEKIVSSPTRIVFGHGLGAATGYSAPLHNEWLQLVFHFGIIGLALAGWFFVQIESGDRMLKASSVIIAVNCLANYPIHLAPSAIVIVIIFGLLERDKLEIMKYKEVTDFVQNGEIPWRKMSVVS